MSYLNTEIRRAIESNDHSKARDLLREAMPNANAETYRLAAEVALDDDQRKQFLSKAEELSPAAKGNQAVQSSTRSSNGKIAESAVQFSSDLTRLVASGALTFGESFRERVITQYNMPFRAAAPEIGVDADLVYRVSSHIQKEAKGNFWMWIGLLVLAFIIFPLAWLLVPGVVIFWAISANNRNERIRKKYANYFHSHSYNEQTIKSVFTNYDPPVNLPRSEQNVVVYRGFSPFVGAGTYLGGWSFPIDIGPYEDKTGEMTYPDEFQLSDLYTAVDNHLHDLKMGNVRMKDYVFAYGSDLEHRKDILPQRLEAPRQTVDTATIGKYMNSNEWGVRYYKWIMIYDWDGEIVLSFFLRFSRRGVRNLFVEFNSYILPPLAEKFHDIDRTYESNTQKLQRIAQQRQRNVGQASQNIQQALLNNSKQLLKELRDEVMGNPRFNYGSLQSIREYSAASGFTRFFQRMDKEMYTKIFENEIFRAINIFLEEHNVQMGDVKERQSFIINQGIMVQGDVSGEGIAIGSGAQAQNQSGNFFGNAVSRLTGQDQSAN